MKNYKIGDTVYRMAQDGRVIKERIMSIYQTQSGTFYNAVMPIRERGFKDAFDSEIDVYEHHIDKLKKHQNEALESHLPYSKDTVIGFNDGLCGHNWINNDRGTILNSDPNQVRLTCTYCKQSKWERVE